MTARHILTPLDRVMRERDEAREALARAAYELQNLVSKYTRAPGENGDRVADLLTADAYRIGSELRNALPERPAAEPPSGGEVTADELAALVNHELGGHRSFADAIVARYDVRRKP